MKAKKIVRSPLDDVQTKPKAKRRRIEVLDEAELGALLDHLSGHWLYMPTLLAANTGMRRGEVLGLRWHDVDFTKGTLEVAQAVEEVAGKLSVKKPKTDRSARTIKLPASLLTELERHRKEQLEQRLKLGLGGRPELVFTSPLGEMLNRIRSRGHCSTGCGGAKANHVSRFTAYSYQHVPQERRTGACRRCSCGPFSVIYYVRRLLSLARRRG